jgi:hypothetical protein
VLSFTAKAHVQYGNSRATIQHHRQPHSRRHPPRQDQSILWYRRNGLLILHPAIAFRAERTFVGPSKQNKKGRVRSQVMPVKLTVVDTGRKDPLRSPRCRDEGVHHPPPQTCPRAIV